MTASGLSSEDLRSLRAFRAAALQVRNASLIAGGATIGMQGSVSDGIAHTQFHLLAEEPFRSLAVSLRLVYMDGEPAHYYRVCNVLYLNGDAPLQEAVKQCRARYKAVLQGTYIQFGLHGAFEGRVAGPEDVFKAWLYGVVFHQDAEQEALAVELSKYMGGFALPFAVNAIGLQLAGVILDLDDVIATFLGETQMPRIDPSNPTA